jgi:chemotaxis protein CheZ
MKSILNRLDKTDPDQARDGVYLQQDLREVLSYVHGIREDFACLAPVNIPGSHILQAKDELGAVVATTEIAANKILDACQVFDAAIHDGTLSGNVELTVALNAIYEACSFQDLTSQRIVKVQRMLGFIESKLETLLDKLGISRDEMASASTVGEMSEKEQGLLNGPSMPGSGFDQSDIDSLF